MEDRHALDVMASFVIAVPGMTPATYWSMTADEVEALARALTKKR